MRRISRLVRSIEPLYQTSSTQFVTCTRRAAFTTSFPRSASITDTIKNTLGRKLLRKQEEEPDNSNIDEVKEAPEEASPANFTDEDKDSGGYVPATTWDGLEVVGGRKPEECSFQGFMPAVSHRPLNNDQITMALRRAVVEIFTLYQAGEPLHMPSRPLSEAELLEDNTTKVWFVQEKNGSGALLQYTDTQTKNKILESMRPTPTPSTTNAIFRDEEDSSLSSAADESEEIAAADRTEVDPLVDDKQPEEPIEVTEANHQETIAGRDPLWRQLSLEDLDVKFAVLKRTLQLSGLRVPDHQLSTITSVQSLLSCLHKPPKARKLSENIPLTEELSQLPNVTFTPRRITPVDKEVKVGRWKVIVKELERMNLPVTGNEGSLKRDARFRV